MNKKLIKILCNKSPYKRKSSSNKKMNFNKPKKITQKNPHKNNKKNNFRQLISLRTNVESGYSATSFPFVFVQPFKQKTYQKKKSNKKNNSFYNNLRTTALVAPLL